MCGIIAMVAGRDVVPHLTDSLRRMEYRGYDSAGIAVRRKKEGQFKFSRRRAKGKLASLMNVLADAPVEGRCGIGHIRWATHGEPTESNAHPHKSTSVMVVHNGIVENWQDLKQELLNKGYVFNTQTDTEVIAHLVQSKLDDGLPALRAFRESVKRLHGAYAIAVMIDSQPNTLFVARVGSPLLIGEGKGEMYAGSDALALAPLTDKVRYLEEGDTAVLTTDEAVIYDKNDTPVQRPLVVTGLTADDTDKGGFPHFMLKEIYDQPEVISQLLAHYIDAHSKTVKPLTVTFDPQAIERLAVVSCGTAYHAGLLGKYWIESLARLPVDTDVASEYRYRDLVQPQNGVFVAVSQSGETADTLAALRRAKAEKQHIVAVVNVESSSMARESMDVLPILAGTEIGVASTKAFVAQAFVMLCLAVWLGRQRGTLSSEKEQAIVEGLLALPEQIQASINQAAEIQQLAHTISIADDVLFLGRGRNYPIALESALKLKEISYIHAEGFASGEMKHGTIALIDEHLPVICLCPNDEVLEKSLSNMQEVIARKAPVILLAEQQTCSAEKTAKHCIVMPKIHPMVSPLLYVVPMQLLSYYTALHLGNDVDQPRNLAKSVTVE
ncbi:MAG: glutamine--fructose-6-phosphate transaminase (isomerizing) [Gammaproteobacteria bacterium]|nr:MAG: glutamine--fructose-6-phosphate transaminase (isomerizing) [Gammaproteobacteria bacterium]